MGGAVARTGSDSTAFSHRDAPFFINVIGHAGIPGRFAAVRDWVQGVRSALAPHTRSGMQPNFASETADLEAHAHGAFVRTRLFGLRARYDPDGLLAPVRSG